MRSNIRAFCADHKFEGEKSFSAAALPVWRWSLQKRFALALVLAFVPAALPAQSGYLYRYGTSTAGECPAAVAPGIDGRALAAGALAIGGNNDALLMMLNAAGSLQSAKRISGPGDDSFEDVKRTADGGYIAVGATNSFGAGLFDGWIMKITASGVPQWRRTFGSARDEHFVRVVQTKDRGYLALGDTNSPETGNDLLLVKFNQAGGVMWKKTLATPGFDHASGLAATADGGFLVSSNTDAAGGKTVGVLTKFTPPGGVLWSRTFTSSYNFHAGTGVLEAPDETIFFLQYVAPQINVDNRSVLSHLSFSGNVLWSRIIRQGTIPIAAFSEVMTSDGGVIVAGETGSSPRKGVIVKIDSTGKLVWEKVMQLSGNSVSITSAASDSSGASVLFSACVSPNTATDLDAAVLRVPESGGFEGGCGALPSAPISVSGFGVTIGSNSFSQPEVPYSTTVPPVAISGLAMPSGRVCSSP